MNYQFTTAIEAQKIVTELGAQLRSMKSYNPDLKKMLRNIEGLVEELSKTEVIARQGHAPRMTETKREEIINAINYLDNLIFMAKFL